MAFKATQSICNDLLQKAYDFHRKGELDQAKKIYQEVLEIDSNNFSANHMMGMLAAQQKNMHVAIEWFKKALSIKPDMPHVHNNLANAYMALEAYDKAEQHYKIAISIDSTYHEAYHNLATLYYKQLKLDEAILHYGKVLEFQPDHVQTHYNLGLLFLKQKKIDEAIRQFNNVINIAPHMLEPYHQLANLYLLKEEYEKARAYYQEVLNIDPEHTDTLVNLGVLNIKLNKPQLAIDYFTKALAIDIDNFEARNNIAALFMQHNRHENALRHYKHLLKLSPNHIEAHYNIAVAYMALGHLDEALEHYYCVLNMNSQHQDAITNLGAVYLKKGYVEKAIEKFQQVLTINPHNSTVRYMLSAIKGNSTDETAPLEYVKNLFDNYALYYDKHMQETLNYQLPYHFRKAYNDVYGNNRGMHLNFLDLGCGTGFGAEVFRDLGLKMYGVDLSEHMLKIAETKKLYHCLTAQDVVEYLIQSSDSFDIIVALDVLGYLGKLEDLFVNVYRRLNMNGCFIFSVEKSDVYPYQLNPTMRFSHHTEYIKKCLTSLNFIVAYQQSVVARQQDQKNVEVEIYLIKKIEN